MHYLNDKYNLPIRKLFFLPYMQPEKYEFYLFGLRKRTCSLVFYVGVQGLSLTLPQSRVV